MKATGAIETICGEFWPIGGARAKDYALIAEVLATEPRDPLVLWKCIRVLYPYAIPVEVPAKTRPPTAKGRAMLQTALGLADKLVAKKPKTRDERILTFWAKTIRALELVLERPTKAKLAAAEKLHDAVYDMLDAPHPVDEEDHIDRHVRLVTLARRRAWELVLAGPPYGGDSWAKLVQYTTDQETCYGWPLRPLARDPAWIAWATAQKPGRGAPKNIDLAEIARRDDPDPEELRGRMLFVARAQKLDPAKLAPYMSGATKARRRRAIPG